jgi:uncharacterized protein (DUF983 family)
MRSGSPSIDEQKLKDFAACIQSSIVRHIETRVHRAILFCNTVQKPQWKRTLVYPIISILLSLYCCKIILGSLWWCFK